MRAIVIGMLLLGATGAAGEDAKWIKMDGAQIIQKLTGHSLKYDNATQDFRASGRTLYNAGQDSWGYWAVRDDKYCSMWPPSDLWSCYSLERQGNTLRFTGNPDDVSLGVLRD